MADETTTQETEPVQETAQITAETTQETAPDPTEERLDRIVAQRLGKYAARTERAETEARDLRERLANVEGQLRGREQAQPQQQVYTQDQLQTLLDAGRITPAQMAGQLALQAKEQSKLEMRQEFRQEARRDDAHKEVRDYLAKIPALGTDTSPEFQKVRNAAFEIAEEMGVDVRDPRVQRRALRETFGTLDRISNVSAAREFSRANADTHTETGGGGGRDTQPKKDDPLKQVSKDFLTYWTPRVTPERLKEMAAKEVERRSLRRRA